MPVLCSQRFVEGNNASPHNDCEIDSNVKHHYENHRPANKHLSLLFFHKICEANQVVNEQKDEKFVQTIKKVVIWLLKWSNMTCYDDYWAPTVGDCHYLKCWIFSQEYQNNSHYQSSNYRVEWLKHLNLTSRVLKVFIHWSKLFTIPVFFKIFVLSDQKD